MTKLTTENPVSLKEQQVDQEHSNDYSLRPEQELRFEVERGAWVKLEVIGTEGNAELFGTELIKNKPYYFNAGQGFGVFTWSGCKIRLTGRTEAAYISKETPMVSYLNVSFAIETLRQQYEKENAENESGDKIGPRVLVCGAQDVGKSTLCRILLNYGVRLGRRPIYIDLAVDGPAFGIPGNGSVGALMVERPADPVEGFDVKAPIIYHFGHTQPNGNVKLYLTLINRLQDIFNTKCLYNSKAHSRGHPTDSSGCIINTCGWVRNQGYEILLEVAKAFEADVVLCLDTEKLYHDLKRDLPPFVNVMHLQKSPGVVPRNKDQRRELRDFQIKQYFEGATLELFPHSFDIKVNEIEIFKIGAPALPESALPIGTVREDTRTQLVKVGESQLPDLVNHILSINHAQSMNENLIETNVSGFVLVKQVNLEKGTITFKSPGPHPLPGKYMLQTNIRYMDHS